MFLSHLPDLSSFVDWCFPNLERNADIIGDKAILTPLNKNAHILNDIALHKMNDNEVIFKSIDSVLCEDSSNEVVNYIYNGVKTKPKLFWFLGCHNLFLDTLGEVYPYNTGYSTYQINVKASDDVTGLSLLTAPIISHTMPMGMADDDKINKKIGVNKIGSILEREN
jgi:hypothetical protein